MKPSDLVKKAKKTGLTIAEEQAAEIIKNNQLEDAEVEDAAGGYYVGSDKYTIEQYNFAGITWEHNFWSKDRYFIRGVQITQSQAEKITEKSLQLNRVLTKDEIFILVGVVVPY